MPGNKRRRVAALQLETFTPFRLNRLAAAVSEHLREIYASRFQLEVPEWRVLATVASRQNCTAQYVVALSRTHKTRVSRAVRSLTRRGLLARRPNVHDGRERCLVLTGKGRRLCTALFPLALAREQSLLACLSAQQRRGFDQALGLLEASLGLVHE